MVIAREKGGLWVGRGGQKRVGLCEMGMERDFAWGNGCTMQWADDVLLSCTLETCINSIKNKIK